MKTWHWIAIGLAIIFIMYEVKTFFRLKRDKELFDNMQQDIKIDATIVTAGGMYGTIKKIDELICDIEIAPNTIVKIERYSIRKVIK